MDARKLVTLVFLLFTILGPLGLCGCQDSSQNSSSVNGEGSPLAPYLPGSSTTPDVPPAEDAPPTGSYPTTNPFGYYLVSQVRSLALDSGATVLGFAADQTNFLMFEQVALTGGIDRWRVLSTASQPGTGVATWTIQCDILGDGTTRLGFAADSTYYYFPGAILSDPNHAQYLRRFLRSNCSEVSPLDTGHDLGTYSTNPFVYSVASGEFIFETYSSSQTNMNDWNLSNAIFSAQQFAPQLAGVNLGYADSVSVASQSTWVISYSQIWKLDFSGNPLAWAALPESSPYAIAGASAIVPINSNTVVVVGISNNEITRYFLDVSNF
jgi:hypothetical protein